VIWILLAGCGQPVDDTVIDPIAVAPDLAPAVLLTRASLDLRGVRPSVDELDAIEADPALFETYLDDFLQDRAFPERVRTLFSEIYLTRQDYYYVTAADYGLDDEVAFAGSVGDEPLRILSHIAEHDLPYTDLVTADWTMGDANLVQAFELERLDTTNGWGQARYTDGRPAAGVLATNGMWWRYQTNSSNANRGRANAISKILLCQDFLSKPIEFDRNVNLLDQGALNEALQTNPGCVACHSSLDPLASYLYGFNYYYYDSQLEITNYHPEREQEWREYTGVPPGYYGDPGETLDDLGRQIASDARFASCITEQVFELVNDRPATVLEADLISDARQTFLDDGLVLRTLFREHMTADTYRKGLDSDGARTTRMISAEQVGSVIEDLTGFRFAYYGYDLLESDTYGVRTLAGGVDGVYSTKAATEPTATMALVLERYAQAAADWAVQRDSDDVERATLFTEIDFSETPASNPDPMIAQLQTLHRRLFGVTIAADGPEIDANLALWTDLFEVEGSSEGAWTGLLSVLLRDPDFLLY
jgi:hypothetical protein